MNLYDKLDDIYNSYDNIEEILNDNFILEAGKKLKNLKDIMTIYLV
ncbi:MAG: hypothetical protein L6V91_00280 [Bacilli bacterium]|nr:MAG: hypothetical protein L6V91_00280 [Bacilli bacterium]